MTKQQIALDILKTLLSLPQNHNRSSKDIVDEAYEIADNFIISAEIYEDINDDRYYSECKCNPMYLEKDITPKCDSQHCIHKNDIEDILDREITEDDYQYTEKGYDPRA